MRHSGGVQALRAIELGVAAALALGAASAAPASRRVALPEGSVIPVRLDRALSSKTARAGDRFSATVRKGNDDAGIPSGSRVVGVVREAIPAEGDKPGTLDLEFRRLVYPSGSASDLTASLVSLDTRNVRRTPGGRMVTTVNKGKDRLKFIGIGAGAGLVIATLTRGKTLQSVLLGAAAGAIYNEVKKDKPGDVNLKPGAEFGVRLDHSVEFTTNRTEYYRPDLERTVDDPYYHGTATRTADIKHEATARHEDSIPARRPDDADSDVGVLLDDRDVAFSGPKPFVRNGTPYAPLAAVAKATGVEFHYDTSNKSLSARDGKVRVGIDSRVVRVNRERRRLKASPLLRDGAIYVPMDLLAVIVGGAADWDESSRTIVVTTREDATR
jgi:hypothetical protein